MERVKRNCTYNDKLLKKGDILYISEPFNFGKQKIFDENRNLIAFCQVDYNDFEWGLPEPLPPKTNQDVEQTDTAEEILDKHTTWSGDVAYRDEESMLKAMQEYADLRNKALQERVKQLESTDDYLRGHVDGYADAYKQARNEAISECIEKVKSEDYESYEYPMSYRMVLLKELEKLKR